MEIKNPKFSFIVTARNDNYGEDFLVRFQIFLDVLGEWAAKYSLNLELIIAEWNPPPQTKSLSEVLSWPDYLHGKIKIIEVPPTVHKSLPNSDRISLFEYIGKNVGIRNATGDFIITTNPDIIFSEELINFFSNGIFDTQAFYRVDRYDVARADFSGDAAGRVNWCRANWFQVNTRFGCIIKKSRIKFFLWRLFMAMSAALKKIFGLPPLSVSMSKNIQDIHTRAAGDFLMMAREQWRTLNGFPEFFTYSHVDAFMCSAAAASGLKQIIFLPPLVIFHQEHDRSENKNRPMTDVSVLENDFKAMKNGTKSFCYNDENWGLKNMQFLVKAE